jgi:Asp-tRNA(Asn)/Glu-tRNA(Gln) amidotransferase B subunit
VLQSHPSQLADYVAGNVRLFPFFVGQVMKATKGSANPKLVNEILTEELKNRTGEA